MRLIDNSIFKFDMANFRNLLSGSEVFMKASKEKTAVAARISKSRKEQKQKKQKRLLPKPKGNESDGVSLK